MLNLFRGFRSGSNAKANIVKRVSDYYALRRGDAVAPVLNNEAALELSTIYAATNIIASGIARTPLRLIETKNINGRVRTSIDDKHYLNKLLIKPNPNQTFYSFIHFMTTNALLGRGALAIKTVVGAEVRELIPVPAGSYTIEALDNNKVQFKVMAADGTNKTFSQDQVLYIKGLSIDGFSGVSIIEKARVAAGLSKSIESAQLNQASSGGNPSGILTFETELEPEIKAGIKEAWGDAYGTGSATAGKSGSVAVLDSGAKFTPVSQTSVDSEYLESRKFQIEEICRYFNIQPSMLGHNSGINSDGISAQMRQHVHICLMPWFVAFEQELKRSLISANDTHLSFDFDEKSLYRGDMSEQVPHLIAMKNAGVLSANEVREELGFDAKDGAEHDELKVTAAKETEKSPSDINKTKE